MAIQPVALGLLAGLIAVGGCQRSAAPIAPASPPPPQAHDAATSAVAEPAGDAATGLRAPDGRPLIGAERVDADVVRVKHLAALLVEANEIRCPKVVRSKSAPVPKEPGPWLLAGDVVETDDLMAHAVTARLVIADEIRAVEIRKPAAIHRWSGAGGANPVRNRVTLLPGYQAPTTTPPAF